MKRRSVLIAYSCGSNIDIDLYCINTILMQDYSDIHLFVYGNKNKISSFKKLFEVLNFNAASNIRSIEISFSSDSGNLMKLLFLHLKNHYGRLIFLPRENALDSASAISDVMMGKCSAPDIRNVSDPAKTAVNSSNPPNPDSFSNHVLFLCRQYSIWPSCKTLFEAIQKDGSYIADLVFLSSDHINNTANDAECMQEYVDAGYSIVSSNDYDIDKIRPALTVFTVPYSNTDEKFCIDHVRFVSKRTMYIPYGMLVNCTFPELIRLRWKGEVSYLVDYLICNDSYETAEGKKYMWNKGTNLVTWGNPRLDVLKSLPLAEDMSQISMIRKMADGKPIILWNTHHSIDINCSAFSTWSLYGEAILTYFKTHPELFLLWRPHPYFAGALSAYLGTDRANSFWNEISKYDNILVDNYKSHLAAFAASDSMISDLSSLAKEYIYTEKPLIVTAAPKCVLPNEYSSHPKVYTPKDEVQLISTIDSISHSCALKNISSPKENCNSESQVGTAIWKRLKPLLRK